MHKNRKSVTFWQNVFTYGIQELLMAMLGVPLFWLIHPHVPSIWVSWIPLGFSVWLTFMWLMIPQWTNPTA